MKIALITGITGHDDLYLAEFLLSKGYKVHGIIKISLLFGIANDCYYQFVSTRYNGKKLE